MERGTAGRRPTSPLLKFDLTVQQRFGVSVGRLVFAVTCCYYQADDCNHNHKHLIVAHEHHLPISTFEESERNPPRYPIMNIWEVEPSIVSRQCHLHHCTYMATYQKFRLMFDFTFPTLSTSGTNSTTATTATTSTDWLQIQPLPLSCKSFASQNSCIFQFQRRILDGRRIMKTPRLLSKSICIGPKVSWRCIATRHILISASFKNSHSQSNSLLQ